jgi:hypothetical protein
MRLLSALFTALLACSSWAQANINPERWRFATDPHGSQAIINGPLATHEQVAIQFKRVPRVDKQNNSWVELIYDLPSSTLPQAFTVELTYKSDKPLIVKLSQKDYGGNGDKSYAHYQSTLPASDAWQSARLDLTQFARPDWTPTWSADKGVITDNVAALYFVPDLTDDQGGEASLAIQSISVN